jgi:L-fuconolactonase
MYVDAHQHFWQYNPAEHTWMNDAMTALKQDFYPDDLLPLLHEIGFGGCIAVQARQSLSETDWLLGLAKQYDFIQGVVGWVDLCSANISQQLENYASESKLLGVRHVVHDEADDNFMLQPAFQQGIAALRDFRLTYDLLLFPKHLPVATKLVDRFPDQLFVLDHLAKPFIERKLFSPWREDLFELAKYPNVYCKLSGMVTETKWGEWTKSDFSPYLDTIVEAFGTERIMIGSDWPVCTLSGSYQATMDIVIEYTRQFPEEVQSAILGGNCINFYQTNHA